MPLTQAQMEALARRKKDGATKIQAPVVTAVAHHVMPEEPLPAIFNQIEKALNEVAPDEIKQLEENQDMSMPATSPWDEYEESPVAQSNYAPAAAAPFQPSAQTFAIPITKQDPRLMTPQQRQSAVDQAVESISNFYTNGGVDLNRQIQIRQSPQLPASPTFVYGLDLNDPNLSSDQKADVLESVYSYTGVTPRDFAKYVNKWTELLGCCVAPIETTNEDTGEIRRFDVPLFKVNKIDEDTGQNVILSGGGRAGKQFAQNMNNLFGVGDFGRTIYMWVTQEERKGQDGEPRRMYRFQFARKKPATLA